MSHKRNTSLLTQSLIERGIHRSSVASSANSVDDLASSSSSGRTSSVSLSSSGLTVSTPNLTCMGVDESTSTALSMEKWRPGQLDIPADSPRIDPLMEMKVVEQPLSASEVLEGDNDITDDSLHPHSTHNNEQEHYLSADDSVGRSRGGSFQPPGSPRVRSGSRPRKMSFQTSLLHIPDVCEEYFSGDLNKPLVYMLESADSTRNRGGRSSGSYGVTTWVEVVKPSNFDPRVYEYFSYQQLLSIVNEMKTDKTGVKGKKRRFHGKVVKHTFTGSDIVSWMVDHLAKSWGVSSRVKASDLARHLFDLGFLVRLGGHQRFDEASKYYSFVKPVGNVLNHSKPRRLRNRARSPTHLGVSASTSSLYSTTRGRRRSISLSVCSEGDGDDGGTSPVSVSSIDSIASAASDAFEPQFHNHPPPRGARRGSVTEAVTTNVYERAHIKQAGPHGNAPNNPSQTQTHTQGQGQGQGQTPQKLNTPHQPNPHTSSSGSHTPSHSRSSSVARPLFTNAETVPGDPISLSVAGIKSISRLISRLSCRSDPQQVIYNYFEEYEEFCRLVCRLQESSLEPLGAADKLAFFLNLYNLMYMHGLVEYGFPEVDPWYRKAVKFERTTGYVVGGSFYSLLDVKYGILRPMQSHPIRRPNLLAEMSKTPPLFLPKFNDDDPRASHALQFADSRITFALCNCTADSPLLTVFTGDNVDELLTTCTQRYIRQHTTFTYSTRDTTSVGGAAIGPAPRLKVILSELFQWYRSDFGRSQKSILNWIGDMHWDTIEQSKIADFVSAREYSVETMPYDATPSLLSFMMSQQ